MLTNAPEMYYSHGSRPFSPAIYHLFADANLADGRGSTGDEAAATILSWLRLVSETRFVLLADKIAEEWTDRGSRVLSKTELQCRMSNFTDLNAQLQSARGGYIRHVAQCVRLNTAPRAQEWMHATALQLFGAKGAFNQKFVHVMTTPDLVALLIDVMAVRLRNVLVATKYPFFISQGFERHSIGCYFISQTECVICNSGAGLEFHMRKQRYDDMPRYLTQYRFQTSHMDRVLAVIRLNSSFMYSSNAASFYENLIRVTHPTYTPLVNDADVLSVYPNTQVEWNPAPIQDEKGFQPLLPDPGDCDESFFRHAQISGSCTMWSNLFWVMYMVHKDPSLVDSSDGKPLTPDLLIQELRLHVGRHVLQSYLKSNWDVNAQTFPMLQIIARHSPSDNETQTMLGELASILMNREKMIFILPNVEYSVSVLSATDIMTKEPQMLSSPKTIRSEMQWVYSLSGIWSVMLSSATDIGLLYILLQWDTFQETVKTEVKIDTLSFLHDMWELPRFNTNQKLYILLMMLRINHELCTESQVWRRSKDLIPQSDIEQLIQRYGALITPAAALRVELQSLLHKYPILLTGVYLSEKPAELQDSDEAKNVCLANKLNMLFDGNSLGYRDNWEALIMHKDDDAKDKGWNLQFRVMMPVNNPGFKVLKLLEYGDVHIQRDNDGKILVIKLPDDAEPVIRQLEVVNPSTWSTVRQTDVPEILGRIQDRDPLPWKIPSYTNLSFVPSIGLELIGFTKPMEVSFPAMSQLTVLTSEQFAWCICAALQLDGYGPSRRPELLEAITKRKSKDDPTIHSLFSMYAHPPNMQDMQLHVPMYLRQKEFSLSEWEQTLLHSLFVLITADMKWDAHATVSILQIWEDESNGKCKMMQEQLGVQLSSVIPYGAIWRITDHEGITGFVASHKGVGVGVVWGDDEPEQIPLGSVWPPLFIQRTSPGWVTARVGLRLGKCELWAGARDGHFFSPDNASRAVIHFQHRSLTSSIPLVLEQVGGVVRAHLENGKTVEVLRSAPFHLRQWIPAGTLGNDILSEPGEVLLVEGPALLLTEMPLSGNVLEKSPWVAKDMPLSDAGINISGGFGDFMGVKVRRWGVCPLAENGSLPRFPGPELAFIYFLCAINAGNTNIIERVFDEVLFWVQREFERHERDAQRKSAALNTIQPACYIVPRGMGNEQPGSFNHWTFSQVTFVLEHAMYNSPYSWYFAHRAGQQIPKLLLGSKKDWGAIKPNPIFQRGVENERGPEHKLVATSTDPMVTYVNTMNEGLKNVNGLEADFDYEPNKENYVENRTHVKRKKHGTKSSHTGPHINPGTSEYIERQRHYPPRYRTEVEEQHSSAAVVAMELGILHELLSMSPNTALVHLPIHEKLVEKTDTQCTTAIWMREGSILAAVRAEPTTFANSAKNHVVLSALRALAYKPKNEILAKLALADPGIIYQGARDETIIGFEYYFGGLITTQQHAQVKGVLDDALQNKKSPFTLRQILMGQGKTSVLLPLLLLRAAQKRSFVIIVVPEHMVTETGIKLLRTATAIMPDGVFAAPVGSSCSTYLELPRSALLLDGTAAKKMFMFAAEAHPIVWERFLKNGMWIVDEFDSLANPLRSTFNIPRQLRPIHWDVEDVKAIVKHIIYGGDHNISSDGELWRKLYRIKTNQVYGVTFGPSYQFPFQATCVPYAYANSPLEQSSFQDPDLLLLTSTIMHKKLPFDARYIERPLRIIIGLATAGIELDPIDILSTLYLGTKSHQERRLVWATATFARIKGDLRRSSDDLAPFLVKHVLEFILTQATTKEQNYFRYRFVLSCLLPVIKVAQQTHGMNFTDLLAEARAAKMPLIGFSGTLNIRIPIFEDGDQVLPETYNDNSAQTEIGYVLKNATTVSLSTDFTASPPNVDELLRQLGKDTNVLVDASAFMLGISNEEVAQKWHNLSMKPVVYMDSAGVKRLWPTRARVEAMEEGWCIYYDQQHTIGTDVRQPPVLHGIITISKDARLSNIGQAAFRLRQLKFGHTVSLLLWAGSTWRDRQSVVELLTKNEGDYVDIEQAPSRTAQNLVAVLRIDQNALNPSKYLLYCPPVPGKRASYFERIINEKPRQVSMQLLDELRKAERQDSECGLDTSTQQQQHQQHQQQQQQQQQRQQQVEFNFHGNTRSRLQVNLNEGRAEEFLDMLRSVDIHLLKDGPRLDLLCFAAFRQDIREKILRRPIIKQQSSDEDLALGPRWQGVVSKKWPVLLEVLEGQRLTIDRIDRFVQLFYSENWRKTAPNIPHILARLDYERGTGKVLVGCGAMNMLAVLYAKLTMTQLREFLLSKQKFMILFYFGENTLSCSPETLKRLERFVAASWKKYPV